MNRINTALLGEVRIELCGAFPQSALNSLSSSGVELWQVEWVDDCTLRFSFHERELAYVEDTAKKCMCETKLLSTRGGRISLRHLWKRKWLILSTAFVAILLMISSQFIWEIDVRGNEELSRGEILRALADCGVRCGSYRHAVSPDLVRSAMIEKLPDIGWMALNVSGSRAVVLIREREEKPEIYAENKSSDMIASKDGLIRKTLVQNGRALVHAGDAVLKGETLISGTMDSITNGTRYVCAAGQVIADTWYERSAVCPSQEAIKSPSKLSRLRFAVVFGKRRINLFISSGKAIDECDKIVKEYALGIDGLFAMPVRLVCEKLTPYKSTVDTAADEASMRRNLSDTLDQNVCGEIVSKHFSSAEADGLFVVTLRAHGIENIAEPKSYV